MARKIIVGGKVVEEAAARKFIVGGKVFEDMTAAPAPGGSIINQMQKANLGADLYNGTLQ